LALTLGSDAGQSVRGERWPAKKIYSYEQVSAVGVGGMESLLL